MRFGCNTTAGPEEPEAVAEAAVSDEMVEDMERLLEEVRGEKCRLAAASYLDGSVTCSSSAAGKPVMERLHDYDIPSSTASARPVLTHAPPKLEPMACKPSFFDVALNYVRDYPVEELEQALEEHGGDGKSSSDATSKGLLGWFRR